MSTDETKPATVSYHVNEAFLKVCETEIALNGFLAFDKADDLVAMIRIQRGTIGKIKRSTIKRLAKIEKALGITGEQPEPPKGD